VNTGNLAPVPVGLRPLQVAGAGSETGVPSRIHLHRQLRP
jgi:hypothetical protein